MKKTLFKVLIGISISPLFWACNQSLENKSETNAKGQVSSKPASVYVYDQQQKLFLKAKDKMIHPGAEVYSLNSSLGKPIEAEVLIPGQKVGFYLRRVVYQNPKEAELYKGFVLESCFNWDESLNAPESFVQSAKEVSSFAAGSKATATGANQLCGIF